MSFAAAAKMPFEIVTGAFALCLHLYSNRALRVSRKFHSALALQAAPEEAPRISRREGFSNLYLQQTGFAR